MTQEQLQEIIGIKDMHKRRTALVKLGWFEASKDARTKKQSLVNIARTKNKYEAEVIWGRKEEYMLTGSYKENYNGFEWLWIEYLVANKALTERNPKDIWIFAKVNEEQETKADEQ